MHFYGIDGFAPVKNYHLVKFYGGNDSTLWGYKEQQGLVGEHIEDFQKLNIRVTNISEEHRIDLFLGTLKDKIQHEVHVCKTDSLEKAFRLARKIECKIMAKRKPTTHIYKDGNVSTPRLP